MHQSVRVLKRLIIPLFILAAILLAGIFLCRYYLKSPEIKTTVSKLPGNTIIRVYFNNTKFNPNTNDCHQVYPLERSVSKGPENIKEALQELFKGPSEVEKSLGYSSWFSADTSGILKGLKIENGLAYVNLQDIRQIIPNVSASCGSAEFLAEVETTLKQFPAISKVIIAIDGQPAVFYEWIQIGCQSENNFCETAPFNDLN